MTIAIDEKNAIESFTTFQEAYKRSWKLQQVSIYYSGTIPDAGSFPASWPFKALFKRGEKEIYVFIRNLSVGYASQKDEGPEVLLNILRFLSVPHDKEDITTDRKKDQYGDIYIEYNFN